MVTNPRGEQNCWVVTRFKERQDMRNYEIQKSLIISRMRQKKKVEMIERTGEEVNRDEGTDAL